MLCTPDDVDALTEGVRRVSRPDYPVEATTRRARQLIEQQFDAAAQAERLAELTATDDATDRKEAS